MNRFADEDIWSVLRQVQMEGVIDSLEFSLVEGGKNLSAGQRQLLALARGMLKLKTESPILILDESTASLGGH